LKIVDGGDSEEIIELSLFEWLSSMLERCCNALVIRRGVIEIESIIFKRVLVAFTEHNLKVVAHSIAKLLELTGVWRQDRNIAALVDALSHDMAYQLLDH
jgi:hypothetical protein